AAGRGVGGSASRLDPQGLTADCHPRRSGTLIILVPCCSRDGGCAHRTVSTHLSGYGATTPREDTNAYARVDIVNGLRVSVDQRPASSAGSGTSNRTSRAAGCWRHGRWHAVRYSVRHSDQPGDREEASRRG